jgi:hypothetical protein
MTAIMVAGRSGSAFAAQIGTMKITEEIDAMRTIGVVPAEALVVPRVIAAVIMMPLLGIFASLMSIIGGGLSVLDHPRNPARHLHHPPARSDTDDRFLDRHDQSTRVRRDHRHGRLLPGDAGRRQ